MMRSLHGVVQIPQNILIAFLKIYRKILSPLYGPVCRYFPSCSAYALEAVTVHGATRGTYLTAKRLMKCHPFAEGGTDPVPAGKKIFSGSNVPTIIKLNHPHEYLAIDTGKRGQ